MKTLSKTNGTQKQYSYVMNNPLKYTDPSGHFPWLIALFFVAVAAVTDIPILDMIATIAFAAALPGTVGLVGAMLKGAAAGFISGIVSNTNPFKAALWGAITAGAAWGVGHGIGGGLWKDGHGFFSEGSIGRNLVHGVAQGTISELRGGNFKSGFVGAVVGGIGGSASGKVMGALGTSSNVFSRTMVAAVFGGLASEATGGSFEDGAMAAAFRHLFNDEYYFKKGESIDANARAFAENQKGNGIFDIFAHGNKYNGIFAYKNGSLRPLSVNALITRILGDSTYRSGMTIKLWACNVPANYAQELSDKLSATVIRSDGYVSFPQNDTPVPVREYFEVLPIWAYDAGNAKDTWGDDWYEYNSAGWVAHTPK